MILLHQQKYDHRNEYLKQVIFRIKRVSNSPQRLLTISLLLQFPWINLAKFKRIGKLHCARLLVHDSITPLEWRVNDQLISIDAI